MIIISARQNFWDNNNISPQDEIREVTLPQITAEQALTEGEFLAAIRGKKVLLLVHGYNNEKYDVLRAYEIVQAKVHATLPDHYDLVIGYSWPGGDDPLDYFAAKRRASAIAPRFGMWLPKIKQVVAKLDTMTHSMGTRLMLSALQLDGTIKIDNAFNMAAAVDNECLELFEKYHEASKHCQKLYVFHSKYDNVLGIGYRAAEWDRALGFSGPEDVANIVEHCPHVKVANCKNVIKEHGAYKTADRVYGYIAGELSGSETPQFLTL